MEQSSTAPKQGWSSSTKVNNRPAARRSILQQFASIIKKQTDEKEEADHVCESVSQFAFHKHPIDIIAEGHEGAKEKKSQHEKQPQLNTVVTLFYHKAAACYEVVTFDTDNARELNRLYIPADEVKTVTQKKRTRISFYGGGEALDNKKLSAKFASLLTLAWDGDHNPYMDCLRPNGNDSSKSIDFILSCPLFSCLVFGSSVT
jgi:hypothetical protein